VRGAGDGAGGRFGAGVWVWKWGWEFACMCACACVCGLEGGVEADVCAMRGELGFVLGTGYERFRVLLLRSSLTII